MDNFLKINKRVYPSIWDLRVDRLTKLQNSDFQSHFSLSKIVRIFLFFSSLKNINLRHQFLLKTFFDKFNFKNILFLKLGRKIVNFLNLSTLSEKLQKKFRCNFCDSASISFIVISFHQILLTWWNAYSGRFIHQIPEEIQPGIPSRQFIIIEKCPACGVRLLSF